MKTRILKKINKYIRIVKGDDGFLVQNRKFLDSNWNTINTFSSYRKAIERKNMYIVMILMRDLGYRPYYLEKLKLRKQKRAEKRKTVLA